MNLPSVTVIVLVHNRVDYLDRAIDSIRRQDYDGEMRILLVDDGSTPPATERFTGDLSDVQVVRQEHGGPAVARQTGAVAAATDLIAYLDDDDLWPESSLSDRVQFLLDNPEVPVVAGDIAHFGPGRAPGSGWQRDHFPRLQTAEQVPGVASPTGRVYARGALVDFVLLNVAFYAQTILARRDWLIATGGWGGDGSMFAEQIDFLYRATRSGPVGYLDKVTANIRRGHEQMTADLELSRLAETRELMIWYSGLPPLEQAVVQPRLARRFLVHARNWLRGGRVVTGVELGLHGLTLALRHPIAFANQSWRRAGIAVPATPAAPPGPTPARV